MTMNEKLFKRAREIVADTADWQELEDKTPHETIEHLASRMAQLENADNPEKRTKRIMAQAEKRQELEHETHRETVQHLAFRMAKLEHADTKDEYSQD